jgi:uncharacterized protein with von Willebrand factor type A (vWA) domain
MKGKTLIDATKWEKVQKKRFQKHYEPMQEAIDAGDEKGYPFDPFSQDLFSALYQLSPEFPKEATPGTQWQKEALDTMQELREYKDIRNSGTLCDSFQSGLGATVMAKHFAEVLPEMEEPNPDELQEQQEAIEDFLESYPDLPEKKKKKHQNALKSIEAQSKVSSQAWQQGTMKGQDLRIAMRQALTKAKEAISKAEGMANAFGYGDEPGKDGYTDVAMKLRVAEKIRDNPKLRKLAELAGRFRREATKAQAHKKSPGPDEITDIEIGADLGRLIPSELMKLAHPLMKLEFARRMLERGLIQYKMESVEKKSRGPIVVCIDNSGSMAGAKEVWSKAIALAMCQIAMDQKRTFEVIHFNTGVPDDGKWVFPAGKASPEKLIDCMKYFSGGGTKFAPVLAVAYKDIALEAEKDLKDADVVFITDGEAPLTDEDRRIVNVSKKATGASLYTICLGAAAPSLEPISDKFLDLKNLTSPEDEEQAKELIFSV